MPTHMAMNPIQRAEFSIILVQRLADPGLDMLSLAQMGNGRAIRSFHKGWRGIQYNTSVAVPAALPAQARRPFCRLCLSRGIQKCHHVLTLICSTCQFCLSAKVRLPAQTALFLWRTMRRRRPPSPGAQEAARAAMAVANFYPSVTHAELRQAISTAYGVDPAHVVCGNGSSEMIALLAQAYTGLGDEVIIGRHGYLYFSICARMAGAAPVYAVSSGDANHLSFGLQAALDAVTPKTRIVFLDNPCNPLGTYVSRGDLRAFRAALPEDVLLVIDAAYADYATADDFDPGDDLVRGGDNTVVLRTFSKIYGLAGLRVGWVHAPPAVVEVLNKVMRPGNLSGVSLAASEAAVKEQSLVAERRERNRRVRDSFAAALEDDFGYTVFPSQANFLLVTPSPHGPVDANGLYAGLMEQGVLVRPMGPYQLPNSLRVSIGTEEEMDIAHAAFKKVEQS